MEAAGVEPDSHPNTNATQPPHKPDRTPARKGDADSVEHTSDTHHAHSSDTSLHEKCAIDVQRKLTLAAFNRLPESLKRVLLNWDDSPQEIQDELLSLLDRLARKVLTDNIGDTQ